MSDRVDDGPPGEVPGEDGEAGAHPFTRLDPGGDNQWWSWVLDLDPFSPTVGGDPAPGDGREDPAGAGPGGS